MEDYPDVSDPLFYKKLYRKAEIWMHHEEQQTFEKLSHPQLFLRDYLNPHTPYRGLLVVATHIVVPSFVGTQLRSISEENFR